MHQCGTGKLVVLGQGYVGLPLSIRAADVGWDVVGFDVALSRVDVLRSGVSPVEDITDDQLVVSLQTGRYVPTSDEAELAGFDVAIICVPTPLGNGPDLSYLRSACKSLAPHISPGCTVVLESTSYPGTTEEVVRPLLEVGGLRAGDTFHLGYSPERIDPGNATWRLQNTPKLVSGLTERCLESVQEFYDSIVDKTIAVPTLREAELAKLIENTFRQVNIALVNELAGLAGDLGIDIRGALNAAATKPFGYMPFTAGPGVGGQCLPVDPARLSWYFQHRLGRPSRLIGLAQEINNQMPERVLRRLSGLISEIGQSLVNSRVLVLGVAYKKNVGDWRNSPCMTIAEQLVECGVQVRCSDPHVLDGDLPRGCTPITATDVPAEAADADVVCLLVDHDAFDLNKIARAAKRVLDCRYVMHGANITYL